MESLYTYSGHFVLSKGQKIPIKANSKNWTKNIWREEPGLRSFFCSSFGRIEDIINCFRNFLTFTIVHFKYCISLILTFLEVKRGYQIENTKIHKRGDSPVFETDSWKCWKNAKTIHWFFNFFCPCPRPHPPLETLNKKVVYKTWSKNLKGGKYSRGDTIHGGLYRDLHVL